MDNDTSGAMILARRGFLVGTATTGLLALPACSAFGGFGLVDAVRRLLQHSAENAFASLLSDDGFWNNSLTRLDLPDLLGSRGSVLTGILTSVVFKDRLQHAFNNIAEDGAKRAAPIVTETIRTIGIENALALINGGPTAATGFLRTAMGGRLVEAMVPALGDAIRVSQEPLVGQAIAALAGIDVGGVARDFSSDVDDAIWAQIGREERAIRANPSSTNDPVLIGVLGAL